MKRWWNDFRQFLPSLLDGMRDYPLTMPFVALGIAVCLASPHRNDLTWMPETANDWLTRIGVWLIRNAPLPKN